MSGFKIHAYDQPNEGVCGIVITDLEYPKLVAQSLLNKVLGDFKSRFPRTAYANFTQGSPQLEMPELKGYIQKYQNPEDADSILKIQKELDETKIVMKQTIESVLERGEKIDDLVAKSDGLSAQSKMFYTQVRHAIPEAYAYR
jgi:synaptobrevin family protein YKT6